MFNFIFKLRIITVQYCDGFCRTSAWINHRFAYVSSLLNLPPSASHPFRLSQSTGFGFPLSDSKSPLIICFAYGNVHVFGLLSQIIPPSPSPTVSKSLFSMPLKKKFYSFIFVSAGSSELPGLSSVLVSRGYSLLQGAGFSLRWLPISQSTGSRACGLWQLWCSGLVVLWHVRSSLMRDQTLVSCISRWILTHWTTREVLQYILAMSNVWDLACFQMCSSGSDTWYLVSKLIPETDSICSRTLTEKDWLLLS